MCANSEDYDGFCHLFMVLIEFNLEYMTEHVTISALLSST